jgi:hypothetical protein
MTPDTRTAQSSATAPITPRCQTRLGPCQEATSRRAARPDQELTPGDRVEGLGNFGKPIGEFGTVEQTNEDDAVVKWDDDGRTRLHQPSLKKI